MEQWRNYNVAALLLPQPDMMIHESWCCIVLDIILDWLQSWSWPATSQPYTMTLVPFLLQLSIILTTASNILFEGGWCVINYFYFLIKQWKCVGFHNLLLGLIHASDWSENPWAWLWIEICSTGVVMISVWRTTRLL